MNYIDKIKKYLEERGADPTLFDYFLTIETFEYINSQNVKEFSLWNFIQDLNFNNQQDKSLFLLSDYYDKNLSVNGCRSLNDHLLQENKMPIFIRLNDLLRNEFPEFKCLGEVRSKAIDFTLRELEDKIKDHEESIKIYLDGVFQSMGFDQLDDYEIILGKISNYIISRFKLDTLTSSELSKFNVNKADPAKIKKNIIDFIKSQDQRD